jgi:hypothetical protein
MRKNMVLISILVAALGSGVAMAKGPAGGGNGGMGGSGWAVPVRAWAPGA